MTNLKKSILSFKKISLDDYDLINSYLINQPFRICDYTPGVLYMWKGYLNYEFAISHDTLIIKSNLKGNVTFSIPLGEGDVKKALDSIKEYCLF
ncbi:MAG: hypothetical protein WBM21_00985, partial [Christensenellales bacterium]